MTRALHLLTNPRSEFFTAPPMSAEGDASEILFPVFFAEESDDLDPSYDEQLDDFAVVLGWFAGQRGVEVRGHADDDLLGLEARALSLRRAQAVVDALEARGVAPGLLRARGLAGRIPASSGYEPLQRAVNRRVELHLMAPTQRAAAA